MENRTVACRINQSVMTFTVVSSFTWVFVEALHLHSLIFVNALSGGSKLSAVAYVALGWGLSALVTAIWILLRILFDDRDCWRQYRPMGADIWLLNSYLCLLVIINAAMFVRIVRELFIKLRLQPSSSEATQTYRKLWKSTSVLVLVFGIYYIIFLPVAMIPKDKLGAVLDLVHIYYEHFFSSFQGFFVALLFCFVNSEVHSEVKRALLETCIGTWLRRRGIMEPGQFNSTLRRTKRQQLQQKQELQLQQQPWERGQQVDRELQTALQQTRTAAGAAGVVDEEPDAANGHGGWEAEEAAAAAVAAPFDPEGVVAKANLNGDLEDWTDLDPMPV